MPIIELLSYFNVTIVNIVATKKLHSEIFSQKACPLNVDVSTENIIILT